MGTTTYNVIFDTGSCYSWINLSNTTLSSAVTSTTPLRFTYPDGSYVEGKTALDKLSIGNFTSPRFSFLSVNTVVPDTGIDGSIALCRAGSGTSSSTSAITKGFSSVLDDMLATIKQRILAFSISLDGKNATLTLGNTVPDKYKQPIAWLPLANDGGWTADMNAISSVDSNNVVPIWSGSLKANFDIASSMIVLPSLISSNINTALFGFSKNSTSSLYYGPCPKSVPANMRFSFSTIALNIQTRSLLFGSGDTCFSSIIDAPASAANGTAIIGNSILRNFYTVFSGINNTMGFASLNSPLAPSNTVDTNSSVVDSSPVSTPIATPADGKKKTVIVVASLGALAGWSLLLCLLVFLWKKHQKNQKKETSIDPLAESRSVYKEGEIFDQYLAENMTVDGLSRNGSSIRSLESDRVRRTPSVASTTSYTF